MLGLRPYKKCDAEYIVKWIKGIIRRMMSLNKIGTGILNQSDRSFDTL